MSTKTYPQNKIENITELEGLLKDAKSIFLADFSGLNVEQMNELRNKFFDQEADFRVVKNTLSKIALNNCGITELDDYLNGPTAIALGRKDPAVPARILFDFARQNEKPTIKSCLFEGRLFGPEKMGVIKNLPTRDEAVAQLIGQIQAPLSNFMGVLNEIIRSFLGVLEAVIQKKGGGDKNIS